MGKPLPLTFPLKGKDEITAYRDLRPGFTPDCLNVLPFATNGRARGGQRPGTSKVNPDVVLGSGKPVDALLQCTVPAIGVVESATAAINFLTLLVPDRNDGVTRNMQLEPNIGAVNWYVSKTTTASNKTGVGTATASAILCQDPVDNNGSHYVDLFLENVLGTECASAMWIGADLGLGDCYYLYSDFYENTAGGSLGAFRWITRGDLSNIGITDEVVYAEYVPATRTMRICKGGAGTVLATRTIPTTIGGTPFTPSQAHLIVTGDNYVFIVGGVFYLTVNVPAGVANTTRVGFGMDGNTSDITNNVANLTRGGMRNFIAQACTPAQARHVYLVAVSGGNIYLSEPNTPGMFTIVGTGSVSIGAQVQMACGFGKVYIVDGFTAPKVLDLATRAVTTHAASVGTLPAPNPGLMCFWRGRLVYAGVAGDEQNIFCSRAGDPDDFLYAQEDAESAFASNSGTAGKIPGPVLALIPFRDDVLLLGLDAQISAMVGDPAAGGTVVCQSDGTGILGANAWAIDTAGVVYFAGTGGFFALAPGGGAPKCLSDARFATTAASIDRVQTRVSMAWERDENRAWVFLNGAAGFVFDATTGGFFPVEFPAAHGPLCAATYDGDGSTDRYTLLGGTDGYIRKLDATAIDDDGTTITSRLYLGPVMPAGDEREAKVIALDFFTSLTAAAFNCDWTLQAADTAENSFDAPDRTATGTLATASTRERNRSRLHGAAFTLKLENTDAASSFAFERIVLEVEQAGRQR